MEPPSSVRHPPTTRSAGLLIGVLVGAAFVMILNETLLAVALPTLSRELDVPVGTVQWLTSGFLLTQAVVVPVTGFLLERVTPRRVLLVALSMFVAGTLTAALAPGFGTLLVARVVQAAAAALMLPLLTTTVMRLVPEDRRGRTMGSIMLVVALAPALGPTVGGVILEFLSWRWLFWFNIPFAAAALLAAVVWMRFPSATRAVPLDVVSVLLSALGFVGVIYGFTALGPGAGPAPLPPWLLIAVGAAALALFVARQLVLQRDDRALLDLRPLAHQPFVVTAALTLPMYMALIGVSAILLPLYLQTVLGASPLVSGLVVLPGSILLGLLGRPVGALFDRWGARPLAVPGAVLTAVALAALAFLGTSTPILVVVAIDVALMVGLALMLGPLKTGALAALPERLYSHGSAILLTLGQVAGALGAAVFVTLATLGSRDPSGTPDMTGMTVAFVVAAVMGLLVLGIALTIRPGRPAPPSTPPAVLSGRIVPPQGTDTHETGVSGAQQ